MSDINSSESVLAHRSSLLSLVQGLGIKIQLDTAPVKSAKDNSISIVIKPRPTGRVSPRRTAPRPLSPRPLSPRPGGFRLSSPRAMSPRPRSPRYNLRSISPRLPSPRRALSPKNTLRSLRPTSPRLSSSRLLSPRPMSPRPLSPRAASPKSVRNAKLNTTRVSSPRPKSPTPTLGNGVSKGSLRPSRYSLESKPNEASKIQFVDRKKPKNPISTQSSQSKFSSKPSVSTTKSHSKLPPKRDTADTSVASPPNTKEVEASKAMVSPRIEFDGSRSAQSQTASTQGSEAGKKTKPSTAAPKESQTTVLNSLVTKVEATNDPGDAGKSKAEVITRKHLYQTFRGLKLARSLPPADQMQLQAKRVVLMKPPGKYRRKTAIFDLDETLVHCLDRTESATPDAVLPIRFPNGDIVHVSPT